MIQLIDVSKVYAGHSRILDRVSLELKQGEFLYVLGATGAGKTTLLNLMSTQDAPSSGEIRLFGYSLIGLSASSLQAVRRMIGVIPQNVCLIPDLSVEENITLALTLGSSRLRFISAEYKTRLMDLLERLGLVRLRHQPARALSGGEAQRVAIARALLRKPELIIADEPTGAQDQNYTWSLMDLLIRSNLSGASVIVATHDREIVRRVRKKCVILNGSKLQLEENLCIP